MAKMPEELDNSGLQVGAVKVARDGNGLVLQPADPDAKVAWMSTYTARVLAVALRGFADEIERAQAAERQHLYSLRGRRD